MSTRETNKEFEAFITGSSVGAVILAASYLMGGGAWLHNADTALTDPEEVAMPAGSSKSSKSTSQHRKGALIRTLIVVPLLWGFANVVSTATLSSRSVDASAYGMRMGATGLVLGLVVGLLQFPARRGGQGLGTALLVAGLYGFLFWSLLRTVNYATGVVYRR